MQCIAAIVRPIRHGGTAKRGTSDSWSSRYGDLRGALDWRFEVGFGSITWQAAIALVPANLTLPQSGKSTNIHTRFGCDPANLGRGLDRSSGRTPKPTISPACAKEVPMYAAIRQSKAKLGMAEEVARRIKEGAIPIISDVEGFMAYYVVYAPDDTVTAISIFNNHAGAEESNRRAIDWIEQNLAPLLTGPATAVAGPVIVHTLA
jgi:hypothetical protein